MGAWILTDQENDRAVLYDSEREIPIPGVGFIGADAREQAESFLAYLTTTHCQDHSNVYQDDPRKWDTRDLQDALERWACLAGDPRGDVLNGYGWALQQWFIEAPSYGTPSRPAPEPYSLRAGASWARAAS